MKPAFARGLAGLLLLALCSCIAYREEGERELLVPTPGKAPKKSIAVLIRSEGSYRGAPRELPSYVTSQWNAAVLGGFRDSGLFSEVTPGIARAADLQATVRIENTLYTSRGLSFLGAVSFLALPFRHRDQFQLSTTLSDRSGAVLGVLRSDADVTTWYQLLLAPLALPFGRDAQISDTLYDLTLDTAARARRMGLL
jgi:hypothetical protein